MKNKKGFTLIEFLILAASVGIVLAIVIPNVVVALNKDKKKNSSHTEYTVPQQNQVREAGTSGITMTEISSTNNFVFYKVMDNGHEYLLVWNRSSGNIAMTSRW